MTYCPIRTLVEAGIQDIMNVTGGRNSGDFLHLLANGKEFGLKHINYTAVVASSEKLMRETGWHPQMDFETNLARTVDWYRAASQTKFGYSLSIEWQGLVKGDKASSTRSPWFGSRSVPGPNAARPHQDAAPSHGPEGCS